MIESYRALSSDFYINQKLSLKLDLPRERQTILDLADRVRRQFPSMRQFRRYRDELALESEHASSRHQWLAIRTNNIRSGVVNPDTLPAGYELHRHILEIAPYFLSISPLDVDYLELLYGFDLLADRNHDEIVFEALVAGSPIARLLDIPGAVTTDCQPLFGVVLRDDGGEGREGDVEVSFEVKTRSASRGGGPPRPGESAEPISVYLTLRKYGPVSDVKQLPDALARLAQLGEDLVESRVIPSIVVPIRDSLGMGH